MYQVNIIFVLRQDEVIIKIQVMSNHQRDQNGDRDRLISKVFAKEEKEINLEIEPSACKHYSDLAQHNKLPPKDQNKRIAQTISNIQSSEQKVKKGLAEMIEEYKTEAQKMMNNHGWDPEKEASIKHHLKKLQKEKEARRARFEQDLKRLQQKKKSLEQSRASVSQDREEKRASIQKRIAGIKEREKKREEQYGNFLKFYQQFKSKKPKYALLEEEFRQKEQQEQEEKLKSDKQRKSEVYKPMDIKSIEQFQENYMNQRYYAQKERLQNHLMERKQEETQRQKLEQLYKGHCHSLVLDELASQNQKHKEPHERYKRIKEYSQIVKEEFKPRVRSVMEGETEESSIDGSQVPQTERGKRVVRDRYLKGEYLGKMVTFEKEALTHQEQLSKGLQYLEYLRSLPKKPKKKEEASLEPISQARPKAEVYRVQKVQNPLYRGSRRYNSIDTSMSNSDSTSVRRVLQFMKHRQEQLSQDEKKLRNGSFKNRRDWESKQKQFNSELVSNIEEKLQILKRL